MILVQNLNEIDTKSFKLTSYEYDKSFHFPIEYMDNPDYITGRIENQNFNQTKKNAFENILNFLFTTTYAEKTARSTNKNYIKYLSEVEAMMLFRLETISSGSGRYNYGLNSVIAIKKARYQCLCCNERDVRCLEIDHKYGKKKQSSDSKYISYQVEDFQILCANHHKIKTLVYEKQTQLNQQFLYEEGA